MVCVRWYVFYAPHETMDCTGVSLLFQSCHYTSKDHLSEWIILLVLVLYSSSSNICSDIDLELTTNKTLYTVYTYP